MNRKQRRASASQTGGPPAAAPDGMVAQQLTLALQNLQAGRLDLAEAGLCQVLQAAPRNPDGHALMGSLHQAHGRTDAAIASYRQALALEPRFPSVLCNLGNVLQRAGRLSDAVDCYQRALALAPNDATVHSNLGSALKALGRLDESIASFERALTFQPGLLEAQANLANALMVKGKWDEAVAAYQRIIAIQPNLPGVLSNLGMVLRAQGKMEEALEVYRRSLTLNPSDPAALSNLGATLQDLGQLDEARRCYERSLALKPDFADVRSNLVYLLNFDRTVDDAALFEAHRAYDRVVIAPLAAHRRPHANEPDPERRLRIGYVSSDFCRHPVGYLVQPALAAHDPAAVEVYCYSGRLVDDDLTEVLRGHAAVWRPTVGVDDAALAEQIRRDGIDILVDLAGHTAGNRLPAFGYKPAPVQASWIGYFTTTGVSTIDYALMDAGSVPPDAERWFTEEVVRLPGCRFCYTPPDYAPAVAPPPMLTRGHVTFGSINNLTKITDEVIALWSAVVRAVPDSRLIMKWKSLADEAERQRFIRAFAAHGVDPARLELRPGSPHRESLAQYGDFDIALDPFPFCGGMTSCEALWMGVPIVTLAGLRPRMAAALCDGPRFTRGLETTYRTLWRRWCEGRRP